MNADAWLSAGIFVLVLLLVRRLAVRGLADVVTLTVFSFALFYGFRVVLLVTGLDTPSPTHLFPAETLSADYSRAVLGAAVFLAALGLGVFAATRPGVTGFAPFFVTRTPDPRRQLRATLVVTACSVLISSYLLAKFGSPSGLIRAAKYDKALAGFYLFRVFPALGSVIAAGAFLDLRTIGGRRSSALVCLVCALVNGLAVFLWGSRALIVVSLVVIAIGLGRTPRRSPAQRGPLRALTVTIAVAVVVVSVAGALRIARDTLTHGETQSAVSDASIWRQASLSTNSVYLDAAILAFRDVPDTFPSRDGADFANGVVGLVPRSIWPGKPTNIAPGSWFRRLYEPKVVNGWPMGAPALWYVNFGWAGVPLGGLLSGLAVGLISARQRRVPDNGHNLAAAAAAAIFVFGLGWDNQTLIYVVLWLVPLWLLRRYLERSSSTAQPPAMRRETEAASA